MKAVFPAAIAILFAMAGIATAAPAPMISTDQISTPLLNKPVYRFAGGPVTSFAASATDWITITGATGKTVRITNMTICGTATSPGSVVVSIVKRSTADSAGTSSAITAVPLNRLDPAAGATAAIYTANPTLGTAVGNIDVLDLNLGTAGSAGCATVDFGTRNGQGITLLGASDQVAINFGGNSLPAGASLTYRIEETEGAIGD